MDDDDRTKILETLVMYYDITGVRPKKAGQMRKVWHRMVEVQQPRPR